MRDSLRRLLTLRYESDDDGDSDEPRAVERGPLRRVSVTKTNLPVEAQTKPAPAAAAAPSAAPSDAAPAPPSVPLRKVAAPAPPSVPLRNAAAAPAPPSVAPLRTAAAAPAPPSVAPLRTAAAASAPPSARDPALRHATAPAPAPRSVASVLRGTQQKPKPKRKAPASASGAAPGKAKAAKKGKATTGGKATTQTTFGKSAKQLRAERNERRARLREGEDELPPPVVGYDASVPTCAPVRVASRGGALAISLPASVQPIRSQVTTMREAVRAMDESAVALLESPTGTGKTLALLAAALAWQAKAAKADPETAPRVVWVARTHDQLQHAVNELRRLPYRPMMSLRLSRERYCAHPNVKTAANKAEACEEATKLNGCGCHILDNAERIRYPQAPRHLKKFQAGGSHAVYDIEEIVNEGGETTTCPFHTTQDLISEGAGLVMITYQQLCDPNVRRAGGMEPVLAGAVVVVDEAHNIPACCRQAATFNGTLSGFTQTVADLKELTSQLEEFESPKAAAICQSLVETQMKLEAWAVKAAAAAAALSGGSGSAAAAPFAPLRGVAVDAGETRVPTWRGGALACVQFVTAVCGFATAEAVEERIALLKKLRKGLIDIGLESSAVRSSAVNDLESFLWRLHIVLVSGGEDHQLLLRRVPPPKPKRRKRGRGGKSAEPADVPVGDGGISVSLVSLRAAAAFEAATKTCRSVLMGSGTLSPFDLLTDELGLRRLEDRPLQTPAPPVSSSAARPIPAPPVSAAAAAATTAEEPKAEAIVHVPRYCLTYSAPHHDNVSDMVLPISIRLADGILLKSTADRRRDVRYLDAIGNVLLTTASHVPNGLLVFFASYEALQSAEARWVATGFARRLDGAKTVFVERQGTKTEDFDVLVGKYRAAAKTAKGAILMGVMRGRASEGADFRDEAARGVVCIGLPLPALSLETRLKIAHGDARANGVGARWYKAEAYREVSQAAGRLIRHKRDYGALVLVDDRFSTPSTLLSPWLTDVMVPAPPGDLDVALFGARLGAFFRSRGAAAAA